MGRSLVSLLTGEGLSYAGDCVRKVAVPTLAVLYLHATPSQTGLLVFATEVPALVVSLPAGVVLGRYPLRHVLVMTDLAAAAVVSVIPAAAAAGVLTMPLLYATALMLGVLSTLHMAASMAAVPLLAGPGHLHQANARFTAVITVAGITGTTLGTMLVTAVGAARAIGADALSYLVSAWCATRLRALPAPERGDRTPMLTEIREGLVHCARDRILRPLFITLTATGVGSGLTMTLLPYHLLTTVRVGTPGLGLVMAAGSAGGLTGALLSPRLVRRYGPGPILGVGFTAYALMQIPPLVAGPGTMWLTVLAAGSYGQYAAATCVGTTQRSVQQWTTPSHLQARVQQTSLWLIGGSQPLTALAAGFLATLTSVRIVMLTGVVVLLLSTGALWRSPVRRLPAANNRPSSAR
ncbi:MFS transporter [Streptomyces sp. NPDC018711]|uniref:MFS transporter n=1 Tax=Streptomyces sp. NPDC018711 TaxID=3365052 RepID=UPI0037A97F56